MDIEKLYEEETKNLSTLLNSMWCGNWSVSELPRLVDEQLNKPIKAPIEIEISCGELNNFLNEEYKTIFDKFSDTSVHDIPTLVKPEIIKFRKELDGQMADYYLRNCLVWATYINALAVNKYQGTSFEYLPNKYIHKGEKTTKVLKHLLNTEVYENFLAEYNKIRNKTKNHNETLVISNRAVDFLTASVNSYDWGSCLHLEDGEFRAGTLVALNSPHYLVAYIKGKEPLEKGTDDKKWRQFIYVSDEAIIPIKGYPYHSIEMEEIIVRELLKIMPDNKYKVRKTTFAKEDFTIVNDAQECLYNDIRNNADMEHFIAVSKEFNAEPHNLYAKGEALCLNCGDPVWATDALRCADCDGMVRCKHCGAWEDRDELYTTEDGERLCYYCYREETYTCEYCGEVYYNYSSLEHDVDINNNIYYNICIECKEFLENNNNEDEERN